MTAGHFLGIDVSKAKIDVVLKTGMKTRDQAFKNDAQGWKALLDWLCRHCSGQIHACMEATGRYGEELALALYEAGHKVSVVNPMRIKQFGKMRLKRNKTDPVDAALIAEYCAVFAPPLWTPPSPARRTLRDLVRVREALKISIVEWQNRLSAGELDENCACIIQSVITKLSDELLITEASIRMTIEGDGDLRDDYCLLTSIPAIGSQTATIVMVELPGPAVLKTAREAAAYAGLNPCENRSGKTNKPTHISRIGNGALRHALYLPALAAFRFNPLVKALRERLKEQGRLRPQQIAAAAMRKLLHLCFGVLKTRKPFDPKHCSAFAATRS